MPYSKTCAIVSVLLFSLVHPARGAERKPGNPVENTLLVINANSDSSKLIGNFYANARGVPEQNIIYLEGIPRDEITAIKKFKETMLLPIDRFIRDNRLTQQIDYIVYSTDFPTKINVARESAKFLTEAEDRGIVIGNKRIYTGNMSTTSATYYYQSFLQDDLRYFGLKSNFYYRDRNVSALRNVFVGDQGRKFQVLIRNIQLGRESAASQLAELIKQHPRQAVLYYWAARISLNSKDVEGCVDNLKLAAKNGYRLRSLIEDDSNFRSIRNEPAFKRLLESLSEESPVFWPTSHFDSNYYWGRNGFVNGNADQGTKYMLCTMLGVSRNQGNSELEILNSLNGAIEADTKGLNGTFYFCQTKDVRSKTRLKNFDFAIDELKRMGHSTKIVQAVVPTGANDIAGLMLGSAGFRFPKNSSKILPGAICDNLTSFGGRMELGIGQTKLSELIRFGAAGSCGTVVEPYALQVKFPHPNLHVHYAKGCTLAESFYQSVAGPFQLLIVGDALCQPYAIGPEFDIRNRNDFKQPVSGRIELDIMRGNAGPKILHFELFVDGRLFKKFEVNESIALDTRQLSDGFHEMRLLAIGNSIARNRSRVAVPIRVDNRGLRCEVKLRKSSVDWHDVVDIAVKTNVGQQVELFQGARKLVTKNVKSGKAILSVPARELGRGSARLTVIGNKGEQTIRSRPLDVTVKGPIFEAIPKVVRNGFINKSNADHLVVTRYREGKWQICTSLNEQPRMWVDFKPLPEDRLLFKLDLTRDRVQEFESSSNFKGIRCGFKKSDVKVVANRFAGKRYEGRFEVSGTYFIDDKNKRVSLGEIRYGVAAAAEAGGDAFLMYSPEMLAIRFADLQKPAKKKKPKPKAAPKK